MITDCYHIYVNDTCIKANLSEEEFDNEYKHMSAFLELTNLTEQARLEFERCECDYDYTEASF